ncbi:hypothetical protein M3Y97_00631100 [Aphelenchoides bicaudatus]|nr:hypothetical protein M3Y97_00631100 [Aphelenchoides bicaudatus]
MHREVFESVGSSDLPNSPKPTPPLYRRQSSGFWEPSSRMNNLDDNSNFRSEAVELMLSWANRLHPMDVQLDRESISQGYRTAELLCSMSGEHFSEDFVDEIHGDKDTSSAGNVRRNEIIRQKLRDFYLRKCKHDMENSPMIFVPATEIAEKDEDALVNFLILIYGIAVILKNSATNIFDQLKQAKSDPFQEYFDQKVKELIEQLNGNDQTSYVEITKDLRIKLNEKNRLLVELRDKVSHLEFELEHHKEELTRYAENNVINQELQRKLAHSQQFEKQIKENEELIRKLELDLKERKTMTESLTAENSKIKFQLEEITAELRDVKDEKSEMQRRFVSAEARAKEFDEKYSRLREDSTKQPSKRDYDVLMERNMKNLAMINDYEQKGKTLESYRNTLTTREIQLEQAKKEYDELSRQFNILKQANNELKKKVKSIEELKSNGLEVSTAKNSETADESTSDSPALETELTIDEELQSQPETSEDLANLQVEVSRLQSDKQAVQKELDQQKRYAEKEKKDILAQVAEFRRANERLAIESETTKSELFRLKASFASLEDKCKRLEEDRTALKNQNAAHEQTIKRAGIIINEYVCQNEDGSSAGLSGGEVLQLKTDVKRLEEQLRQKRSQSDAYRHISTEEQRLITTEWYEQASQNLRQKYLASASTTLNNGDTSRASMTPDQFNYTAHSHLSDLQNSALSSARSTPPHPNTSTNSTPSSSMTNSVNASVENAGVMGQFRSFLGLQRDIQTPRTPNSM